MSRPHRNRQLIWALYINAALLLAILAAVISRSGSSMLQSAYGQQAVPPAITGGNGVYVMPAQFLERNWGCYVLDTENKTLDAYAWYGSSSRPELKLIAARNIAWDRQLMNWNTSPSPDEIKTMVQLGQQPTHGVRVPANAQQQIAPEPAGKSE